MINYYAASIELQLFRSITESIKMVVKFFLKLRNGAIFPLADSAQECFREYFSINFILSSDICFRKTKNTERYFCKMLRIYPLIVGVTDLPLKRWG
jgi:hypothetical protein